MGWAERANPKSRWNQSRNSASKIIPTQQASTPRIKAEPVVVELSLSNLFNFIRDFLCRLSRLFKSPIQTLPQASQGLKS